MGLINRLYMIERAYKKASHQDRYTARKKQAMPILDTLFKKAKQVYTSPKSQFGKAITYLLNNEPYLRAYVHHGQANISNCWVENIIRPFAVGRKNWLFVGNEQSAQYSALLYSLIQTCKLNKINPTDYFNPNIS